MRRLFISLTFFFICLLEHAQGSILITAGPEIYHIERVREGGTHQCGRIDGFRVCIERMKRYGWYLAADYLYGQGAIKGASASGRILKSSLSDEIVEGRLGFTLQQKEHGCPYFTPFAGWGYFKEINNFSPPSPITYKFTDTFSYVAIGFLSGVNFTPLISMGINLKLKFMQDGKSEVTNDPMFDDVSLIMKEEIQIRLDVPLTYSPCNTLFGTQFQVAPFFEYRHFGGREGFPFNFNDTKFYLYGAKLALIYQF